MFQVPNCIVHGHGAKKPLIRLPIVEGGTFNISGDQEDIDAHFLSEFCARQILIDDCKSRLGEAGLI